MLIHAFIPDICIAPLQVQKSNSTQRHSWLQHWYCVGINTPKRYREWRTCSRSQCGS